MKEEKHEVITVQFDADDIILALRNFAKSNTDVTFAHNTVHIEMRPNKEDASKNVIIMKFSKNIDHDAS